MCPNFKVGLYLGGGLRSPIQHVGVTQGVIHSHVRWGSLTTHLLNQHIIYSSGYNLDRHQVRILSYRLAACQSSESLVAGFKEKWGGGPGLILGELT